MKSWTKTKRSALAGVMVAALALGACGSDEPEEEKIDLTAPPQGVSWTPMKGVRLPVSEVHGPEESGIGGSVGARGYERSPQGAGLAAVNQPVRALAADDRTWGDVAFLSFAPGPGRDVFSVNRAQVSISGFDAASAPTIEGWKILDYSPDFAHVAVFSSYPDASLAKTTYRVVWLDGDWRVELPADGQGDVESIAELPGSMVEVSE